MLDAPVAGRAGRPAGERRRWWWAATARSSSAAGRSSTPSPCARTTWAASGAGARAKLVVNLVLGLNRLALAEGLLFGLRRASTGLDLLAMLKDSAAYSRAMDIKGERMLTDPSSPRASSPSISRTSS